MNNKREKAIFFLYLLVLLTISCSKKEENTTVSSALVEKSIEKSIVGKVFGLTEDEIFLFDAPNDKANKIINRKATEALGRTEYISVDTSCKVKVIEIQNDWVKVQVVDPEWLKETHIGWTNNIFLEGFTPKTVLANDSYTIIKRVKNSNVENVYVVYTKNDINQNVARAVIAQIRESITNANIYVFDDEKIITTFDIYPLSKEEYLKVADRFICMSSFDAPLAVTYYPYQDIQYKEYGGKNWKTEPIK
jgi:hypothetical protein